MLDRPNHPTASEHREQDIVGRLPAESARRGYGIRVLFAVQMALYQYRLVWARHRPALYRVHERTFPR